MAEATETPAWGHGEEARGTHHGCMELGTQKKRVRKWGKGNMKFKVTANDHSQKWMEHRKLPEAPCEWREVTGPKSKTAKSKGRERRL